MSEPASWAQKAHAQLAIFRRERCEEAFRRFLKPARNQLYDTQCRITNRLRVELQVGALELTDELRLFTTDNTDPRCFDEPTQDVIEEVLHQNPSLDARYQRYSDLILRLTDIRCLGSSLLAQMRGQEQTTETAEVFPLPRLLAYRLLDGIDEFTPSFQGPLPSTDGLDYNTLRRLRHEQKHELDLQGSLERMLVSRPPGGGLLPSDDLAQLASGLRWIEQGRKALWDIACHQQREVLATYALLHAGPDVTRGLPTAPTERTVKLLELIGERIETEALSDREFGRADAVLIARAQAVVEPSLHLARPTPRPRGLDLGR